MNIKTNTRNAQIFNFRFTSLLSAIITPGWGRSLKREAMAMIAGGCLYHTPFLSPHRHFQNTEMEFKALMPTNENYPQDGTHFS